MKSLIPAVRKGASALLRRISRIKPIARYLYDREWRYRFDLIRNVLLNVGYAVFYFISNIIFDSYLMGTVALYYIILSLIRYSLMINNKKVSCITSKPLRVCYEWRLYGNCGVFILLLSIAMVAVLVVTASYPQPSSRTVVVTVASMLYTLYRVGIVVLHSNKANHRPLILASKRLDLVIVLMSLFSLQATLCGIIGLPRTVSVGVSLFFVCFISIASAYVAMGMVATASQMHSEIRKDRE